MYFLYILKSDLTEDFYIGMTVDIKKRMASHRFFSKSRNSKLYDSMNFYGVDSFYMNIVSSFEDRCECEMAEICLIEKYRDNANLLNVANGGIGGFVIQDSSDWKEKLSASRAGRTPALGMKHSDASKKLSSDASNKYWSTQEKYDAEEICKHYFKQANLLFGISKTHYYRLKRSLSSEQ